ncbi:5-dehydro-2-deoxygluconokinase [Rhizobium rhizosphaerae]|uniref:5-dehydro-2-deoxygluconokinase n=1 Tax=Xaviernesmea rhizosphaerae TaxID=1672749 RepID=A0A1Q9ALY1_9HYPH|nr:5-dehydro-2-deoxygluconokinase [Xaviernesmea rhizosphaerae]OLP56306.1 5-dehydro-2-deoxygluconokinase [Xaviernesmea rhizosphaerae]
MGETLDVITIGRSSVDLYGAQVGGRLEDMGSFRKYIGGSPTNMAAGTARLGLRSALITRVGDEHMGRFIREELAREGVDVSGVKTDPERLTALVLLGIRDDERFPLIFYRENCADMALCEDDIDEALIARARSVVATGTHLSHVQTEKAVLKALDLARKHGARTALDIDYRPNLWGVAGHGDGESRFVESRRVTEKLQSTLHLFDLIVGTEEEFHIAGGSTDTIAALKAVRAVSEATLVCKRGAHGAVAFTGAIPATLDKGERGPGFPIEVFNVLGAGDGFMSGLIKGWLEDAPWPRALQYANACGAFAVSRHGCTPAYPSLSELDFFLERGVKTNALRHDAELEQIHWSTNRHGDWSTMRVFAFDHRMQLETMAGAKPEKIGAFKQLCLRAALGVQNGQSGYGILCDSRLGRKALQAASGTGLWIGRPVEWPGSRPLTLEPEIGPDFGGLDEWPLDNVVKVLCFCHPDDDDAMQAAQEETVKRLFASARRNRLEFLLEIVPSKVGPVDEATTATLIRRFYEIGIYPDWWKLEPMASRGAWEQACAAIIENDPHTRGIVVLGLDAPEAELAASFAVAAEFPLVKGFAVGRTIFAKTAGEWLAGRLSDDDAVAEMQTRYRRLCDVWDAARGGLRQDETAQGAEQDKFATQKLQGRH